MPDHSGKAAQMHNALAQLAAAASSQQQKRDSSSGSENGLVNSSGRDSGQDTGCAEGSGRSAKQHHGSSGSEEGVNNTDSGTVTGFQWGSAKRDCSGTKVGLF